MKKLVITAMTAFILVSCTREVIVEVPTTEQEEGFAKVKLSLTPDNLSTRASGDHSDSRPTEDESRIYNYAVLIFNSQYMLEDYLIASPYSPETSPGSLPEEYNDVTPLTFTNTDGDEVVLTLTSGYKYFFALVNAPKPLLDRQTELVNNNTTTLTDLQWTLDITNMDLIATADLQPTGDNRGFMMTSKERVEGKLLQATEDETYVHEITLKVGRAMAKVSLASDLEVPRNEEQQRNGELTDIKYKVGNNPNKMNVIPDVLSNGLFITPYYYLYSDGSVDRNNYFNSSNNYILASTQANKTSTYCMENSNKKPKEGNTTVAYIQGVYEPAKLLDADGNDYTGSFAKGDNFYRIANNVNGKRVGYEPGYYAERPDDSLLGTDQEVVEYPGGITYYALHLKNEQDNMSPYTVKRNSYYKIDIVEVHDAGEEDEDNTIDPEEPLDGEANVSVRIEVLDWDEVSQTGKL